MTGFSNEALLELLGGTLTPLIDAIKAGKVRKSVIEPGSRIEVREPGRPYPDYLWNAAGTMQTSTTR
jgi:hypothetical protein